MTAVSGRSDASPRQRILDATAELLAQGGREAVSTRAISAAAGVQAQTIYRQFGDMRGLMDAVADAGWTAYLETKTSREPSEDPVEELRHGWDVHVEFGLAHPALFKLTYGDPRSGAPSAVHGPAHDILTAILHRVAETGRLRVSVDTAAAMIHSAGVGVTLGLIGAHANRLTHAHAGLSHRVRDAVFDAILTPSTDRASNGDQPRAAHHAVALTAVLPIIEDRFSAHEAGLLREWLDRITEPPAC
jgi:AcrR family transcriptional regulator